MRARDLYLPIQICVLEIPVDRPFGEDLTSPRRTSHSRATVLSPLLRDGRVPLWHARFQRVIKLIERSRGSPSPSPSIRRGIAREPFARYAGMEHKRPAVVAPLLPMLMSPLRYPTTRKSPGPRLAARFSASSAFSPPFLSLSRSLLFFLLRRSTILVTCPLTVVASSSVDDARPARRLSL